MSEVTSYRVTIKCGKKKHKNVEIKSIDTFDDIQGIIFSLTQITPERQKIIIVGKKLENDDDVKKLIKKGVLITVMGSNAKKKNIDNDNNDNKINVKFVENMTDAEKQNVFAELPPGLYNLGNTCYLNSCIQCIKSVNELKDYLKKYSLNNLQTTSMATKLGKLMTKLDSQSDAVMPQEFVQYFRRTFPRFASRNEHGIWEQQDADEAYTEILSALRQDNQLTEENKEENIINKLFCGEFESKTICTETEDEPELNITEKFIKLQCFIDNNTRHINDGIKKGFTEDVEKRSDKLERNAIWKKTKLISKLPKYIPVQLVRFFWKQKTQKNAKILRKVIFPEKLDVYDFCNDKLKQSIEKYRKLKLEKEKEKDDKDNNNNNNEQKMDVDNEDNEDNEDKIDLLLTGYYELCGIVTHKGRSANSGHYIGYAKDKKRNKWLKFDDEDTTEIKPDAIKQLYGGGDFQMAFEVMFRRIDPDDL